jgi:hypothetical protein
MAPTASLASVRISENPSGQCPHSHASRPFRRRKPLVASLGWSLRPNSGRFADECRRRCRHRTLYGGLSGLDPGEPRAPGAGTKGLEAATGVEPVMEVLQTSALPLGYAAPHAGRPRGSTVGSRRVNVGRLATMAAANPPRRRTARRRNEGQTTEPSADPLLCPFVPSKTGAGEGT